MKLKNEELGSAESLSVTILHRQRKIDVDKRALRDIVGLTVTALEAEERASGEVSFVLVSDRRIRQLNRDFANIDETTDVLSFSATEGGMEFEDDPELGDVIVSVETALGQVGHKDRSGHPRTMSLVEELALLFVHGVLHLMGHDHAQPDEAEKMMASEQRVMARVRSAIQAGGKRD